ncbi:MAG: hypothetical protein HUU26_02370 [Gemmatimonadaceae bacterium]|nr:hypothetical protein [Gemmatimonadaceae bacterium]
MVLTRFRTAITVSASALALACGGDGSTTGPGDSGTITITSTAIANQSGRILVVSVQPSGQPENVGRACVPITSNAFTVPATVVVEPAPSGNPCDPASTPKVFASGRYTLTASVFTPGSQTAEVVLVMPPVEVSGSVTVSLNGAALSR